MTAALGEAATLAGSQQIDVPNGEIDRLRIEYEGRPNRGRAADLLGAAVVAAKTPADVVELATDVLKADATPPLVRELAEHIQSGDGQRLARALDLEAYDNRARVHRLRSILTREPRNAVRWADMAREYLALGQVDRANHAMHIARALAPHDRFILRSSVALLAEQDRLEEAARLLASEDQSDPWILAPLLAVSDLAGMKPRRVHDAFKLLEDGGHPAVQTAELAAAIGSLEFASGSDRRGRQLIRRALEEPTENALAQAVWLSDRTATDLVVDLPPEVPRTYEAFSRQAAHELKWPAAVGAAESWLLDQPFSTQAAIFGSWAACEGEDWLRARQLANSGLQVNPSDPALLNNLALAEAERGLLPTAAELLEQARRVPASPRERAVLAATEGLTFYRAGLADLGRRRYEVAIRVFQRLNLRELAARAAVMVAREEIMLGSDDAAPCVKRAQRLAQGVTDPAIRRRAELLDRIAHPSGFSAELAKRALAKQSVARIASPDPYDLDD